MDPRIHGLPQKFGSFALQWLLDLKCVQNKDESLEAKNANVWIWLRDPSHSTGAKDRIGSARYFITVSFFLTYPWSLASELNNPIHFIFDKTTSLRFISKRFLWTPSSRQSFSKAPLKNAVSRRSFKWLYWRAPLQVSLLFLRHPTSFLLLFVYPIQLADRESREA